MSADYSGFTNREALWQSLRNGDQNWDMVIVGGGIIGAGYSA